MTEIWVPIRGYESLYEVSDFGRVRSLDRYVKVKRYGRDVAVFKHGRILKNYISHDGSKRVNLWSNGFQKGELMHRIVGLHFIPNPKNLPEINHLDFNRNNNNVDNLEWSTHEDNIAYSHKNGRYTARISPRRGKKLTAEDVDALRSLIAEGATNKELARWFTINKKTVRKIKAGSAWR